MTSEHYFQAQKFCGTEFEEIIRLLNNPMKATEMGRSRDLPLREDSSLGALEGKIGTQGMGLYGGAHQAYIDYRAVPTD